MTRIVENWTDIQGRILSHGPSAERPDSVALAVRVQSARPVAGFANLLGDRVGERLPVEVKRRFLGDVALADGARISLRVRRGRRPDEVFCHPDHIRIGLDEDRADEETTPGGGDPR